MSKPSDGRGRYRFQGDQPLNPDAVCPEMAAPQSDLPLGRGIPASLQDARCQLRRRPPT